CRPWLVAPFRLPPRGEGKGGYGSDGWDGWSLRGMTTRTTSSWLLAVGCASLRFVSCRSAGSRSLTADSLASEPSLSALYHARFWNPTCTVLRTVLVPYCRARCSCTAPSPAVAAVTRAP